MFEPRPCWPRSAVLTRLRRATPRVFKFRSQTTITEPPLAPFPPFGPPMATYFSLRKLKQPSPPSPPLTSNLASSQNPNSSARLRRLRSFSSRSVECCCMLCRVARGGGAREAQVARTNAARSMAAEGLLLYQSPLALRRMACGDRCRPAAMRTLFVRRVRPRYAAALNCYARPLALAQLDEGSSKDFLRGPRAPRSVYREIRAMRLTF